MIYNLKNLIEINKKKSLAGRTPAKFVLHRIYDDPSEYNSNGISWNREYTENCIDSVCGMPLVCQFADDDFEVPFGGHGEMSSKDGEIVFEESLVVGSFESAYIDDNVEINGKKISALVGSAYIYNQRFPELVDYLQEQYDNNEPVESSVEICADKSKGNSKIIYDGGWKEKGRVPKDYQYSGQALCIGVDPADNSALMIELNSAKKLNTGGKNDLSKKKVTQNVELCELSYDDISIIITRAFNKVMNDSDSYYGDYGIFKLYPSGRVVFYNWYKTPSEYYMTNYTIQGNTVSIGEISKVEMDFKPVDDEQEVEINIELLKTVFNYNKSTQKKEEKGNMADEKTILELNQKISDSAVEINTLKTDKANLETKNTELNTLITDANKTVEELNTKITGLESELNTVKEELNTLKTEKEAIELEAKKVEINTYFDTEIPKNGFEEDEINSLKHFVEEVDIDGLKAAESELCAKKFKEMKAKETIDEGDAELNSKGTPTFIAFHEKEKKVIRDDKLPTFFNE